MTVFVDVPSLLPTLDQEPHGASASVFDRALVDTTRGMPRAHIDGGTVTRPFVAIQPLGVPSSKATRQAFCVQIPAESAGRRAATLRRLVSPLHGKLQAASVLVGVTSSAFAKVPMTSKHPAAFASGLPPPKTSGDSKLMSVPLSTSGAAQLPAMHVVSPTHAAATSLVHSQSMSIGSI